MDGDSYRYHAEPTEVIQTGNGTINLKNDFMPVVPTIITTSETVLKWKVGEDSFHKTLSSGTWVIPEFELYYGSNSVSIETTGTVSFSYREGCL